MSDSLVLPFQSLLKTVILTRENVLELTECIIQEYLDQQKTDIDDNSEVDNEPIIDVNPDGDGDYIDKDGYIYSITVDSKENIKTGIRIGEKDLKTNKKTMYHVI